MLHHLPHKLTGCCCTCFCFIMLLSCGEMMNINHPYMLYQIPDKVSSYDIIYNTHTCNAGIMPSIARTKNYGLLKPTNS